MKKLALTLIALGATLGLAAETFAQAAGPRGGAPGQGGQGRPGGPGQGGPGGRMRGGGFRRMQELQKKVFAQLKLTPAQQKKVDALNKKTQAKMQDLMKDFKPGGDNGDMRSKFRAVQEGHRKELNTILTPDQQKKYDALWKAERAKMRQQRGPGGPGGARPGGPAGGAGRPGGRPGG